MAGYGAGACIALLRTGAVLRVASLLDMSFLYRTHAGQLSGGPTRQVVCHIIELLAKVVY